MVRARHVVHDDIVYSCLGSCTCNDFGSTLSVAIHRAVADYNATVGVVATHAVVSLNDACYVLMPNGAVSRTDVVELHAGKLLECLLNRNCLLYTSDAADE